jgi:TM2 domain-containing membrane protein YozV
MRTRGKRLYLTLGGLVLLAAVLIGISGIPRFKNGHGVDGVIGGIGWFGGLLTILFLLFLIVRTIVLARRERRLTAGSAASGT